jgi:hypothetical protein
MLPLQKKILEPIAWVLDVANSNDEIELLNLFLDVFGHKMSPELWRWKYQGLDTLGTLVRRDGRIVAFYGAALRNIHLFGTPVTVVQICDVMVLQAERGILTRKGPFFLATANFLENFLGYERAFPFAFGFPSERHFRLASLLGLYDKVGEIMQITWTGLKSRPSYKFKIRPLNHDKDALTVERLWQEMASAMNDQIIGVRDWTYLQHRYLKHPTLTYQLYLISSRLTGAPIGIIVVRVLDDALELLDIIAPPQQIATLVHCLRRLSWRLGKEKAYCWITQQHAQLFAGDTGDIITTGIVIPHNRWTKGIPANELLDHWWLMAGDTDFR